MVSSTAAQSGMKLIQAVSFSTSLQFMCCQVLRNLVPLHQNVCDALVLPPGLRDFLLNNLSWLLQPCLPPDKEDALDAAREEEAASPASTVDLDTDSDSEEEEDVLANRPAAVPSGEANAGNSSGDCNSNGEEQTEVKTDKQTDNKTDRQTMKQLRHSDAELSDAKEAGLSSLCEARPSTSTDQGWPLTERDNSSSAQNNRNIMLPSACAADNVHASGSKGPSGSETNKAPKRRGTTDSDIAQEVNAKKPKCE